MIVRFSDFIGSLDAEFDGKGTSLTNDWLNPIIGNRAFVAAFLIKPSSLCFYLFGRAFRRSVFRPERAATLKHLGQFLHGHFSGHFFMRVLA